MKDRKHASMCMRHMWGGGGVELEIRGSMAKFVQTSLTGAETALKATLQQQKIERVWSENEKKTSQWCSWNRTVRKWMAVVSVCLVFAVSMRVGVGAVFDRVADSAIAAL